LVKWAEQRGKININGGTAISDQKVILKNHGVEMEVKDHANLQQLTQFVEEGRGVIINVNSGKLWDIPRQNVDNTTNHAVAVIGVARDIHSNEVKGFIINDSGTGDRGRFVSWQKMEDSFVNVTSKSRESLNRELVPGIALVTKDVQERFKT
jgi:hypothetical protein